MWTVATGHFLTSGQSPRKHDKEHFASGHCPVSFTSPDHANTMTDMCVTHLTQASNFLSLFSWMEAACSRVSQMSRFNFT